MSTINWNHDLELAFLEVYQTFPIVWDPKERDHKDRNKVHDAWTRMSEALEIPIKELKNKKDSLMTTFRMHKRKIKASQQSGAGTEDIYSPIWFAFNLMDSFLGDIVDNNHSNKTRNTLTMPYEINNDQNESQHSQSQETDPASNDTTLVQPNTSQTIRRRKSPPELREAGKTLNETLNTLNEVLHKDQSKHICQEKEDECDLYGKIFAKKMRKIPEDERMSFMYEIDGMFIRRLSRITMSFPPTSNRMSRPSSTCTSYSEPILQQDYRIVERSFTPSLSYNATSPPQQNQLSQQHMFQERPPSTSGLLYIATSPPQQHQLSQQHMFQERPRSTSGLPYTANSTKQNLSQKPVLIHIPEQFSSSSPVVDSQNSISILSDTTLKPPSDESTSSPNSIIITAFQNA